MTETFLILLAGGVMLAAAVSDPHAVTLQWLRLAGIIALSTCGLAIFFHHVTSVGLIACAIAILGQLAFVQVANRLTQRIFAGVAFVISIAVAAVFLTGDKSIWTVAATAGTAAMMGLSLMDMLLGHAYLTASKMTIAPFRRLNGLLAIMLIARAILAVGGTMLLQHLKPVAMLWDIQGLYIGTRWLVGLIVPAIFVYMAHDCIKRRATQSATGILYVAGVLIFIGEIIGLNLIRNTGLPF